MLQYGDFRVLSFDCYGTLIDWETGLLASLRPWRERCGVDAGDEALLAAFGRHEAATQKARPGALYTSVLEAVLREISREFGAPASDAECAAFGLSPGSWPPFPDSAEALAALRRKYMLCVLSNVDAGNFARSAKRLGVSFDFAYIAQEIGSFKPDPRNFEFMLHKLSTKAIGHTAVLHVAQSLYHDHAPAQAAGLRSVWIDRRAGRAGGAALAPPEGARYDARFESLAGFAAAALA